MTRERAHTRWTRVWKYKEKREGWEGHEGGPEGGRQGGSEEGDGKERDEKNKKGPHLVKTNATRRLLRP